LESVQIHCARFRSLRNFACWTLTQVLKCFECV
jgi:hypothetical protein